jgi:flagella basal body P-ring formation protein FlgA
VTRRVLHPLLLVALIALVLLSARLAGAQQATPHRLAFATHAIARGAVLSADDFEYRDSTSRTPLDTSVVSAGWVTRRTIAAGEVLREPAVQPPVLVTANQPVEIEFRNENISLTMRGTSTRSGALGEHVTVRTEAGKRIEATVVAAGRVRID